MTIARSPGEASPRLCLHPPGLGSRASRRVTATGRGGRQANPITQPRRTNVRTSIFVIPIWQHPLNGGTPEK
jgi:hypothetical protein